MTQPDITSSPGSTSRGRDSPVRAAVSRAELPSVTVPSRGTRDVYKRQLRDYGDHFLSVPDYVAAQGMRILGAPLPGDPQVIPGESGEMCIRDSLEEVHL